MQTVRYLSLCSGVGGFELGILSAGEKLGIDFECVGYAEIDKWAIQTYERHFDHHSLGDVQEIEPAALPGFDLLVAGFPCQSFSTAGTGLGFDDERGSLFFDIARILQHSRPRHFVLENVKGLLDHGSGETFQAIIRILTGLGYCVEWQVLDSQDYSVPQSRERIFIVGHLGGIPARPVFPLGVNVGRKVDSDPKRSRYGDRVFSPGTDDTPAGEWFGCVRDRLKDGSHLWSSRQIATTIDANYGSGPGYMGNRVSVARVDNCVLRARRLTPRECERVMGFPHVLKIGDMNRDELAALALSLGYISVDPDSGKVFRHRGGGGRPCSPVELDAQHPSGYLVANVSAKGIKKGLRLHRVVWIASHGVPPEGMAVCHRNNVKSDNRLSNLYLATSEQNSTDAARDGLYDHSALSKIDFEIAESIREQYQAGGTTIYKLAERYGISKSRVSQIVNEQGWTAAGHSDTQRYRQMGNAVVPNCVQPVILGLYQGTV